MYVNDYGNAPFHLKKQRTFGFRVKCDIHIQK